MCVFMCNVCKSAMDLNVYVMLGGQETSRTKVSRTKVICTLSYVSIIILRER